MRKITLIPALLTAAVIALGSITVPAPAAAEVSIQINGYLPAPPGVRIYSRNSRPYYVRHNRRVYMERDRRHQKNNRRNDREDRGRDGRGDNGNHGGRGR